LSDQIANSNETDHTPPAALSSSPPHTIASKDYRDEVALYKAIDHKIVELALDLKFVRLVHREGEVREKRVAYLVTAFRILVADFSARCTLGARNLPDAGR